MCNQNSHHVSLCMMCGRIPASAAPFHCALRCCKHVLLLRWLSLKFLLKTAISCHNTKVQTTKDTCKPLPSLALLGIKSHTSLLGEERNTTAESCLCHTLLFSKTLVFIALLESPPPTSKMICCCVSFAFHLQCSDAKIEVRVNNLREHPVKYADVAY